MTTRAFVQLQNLEPTNSPNKEEKEKFLNTFYDVIPWGLRSLGRRLLAHLLRVPFVLSVRGQLQV